VNGAPVVGPAPASAGTTITATATCGVGKVLLGGGGQVQTTGAADNVSVLASYPSSTTTWTTTGVVLGTIGASKSVTVTAYAICGNP
jgi:hypothetical protein